jgi:hypothetical protein
MPTALECGVKAVGRNNDEGRGFENLFAPIQPDGALAARDQYQLVVKDPAWRLDPPGSSSAGPVAVKTRCDLFQPIH